MSLAVAQFESLALAEMDTLHRMARRLTHDANRADDLVQETYARALRSRDKFQLADYGIKPWLLRIMHNLHLNRVTREKRQPAAVADETLEAGLHPSDISLPLDSANFEAMDEHLVHALDELPAEYRTVMLLWAVEDLSYKEIATTLDVPIGTVMSRLYRARQRLADQLRAYATEQRLVRE